MQGDSLTLKTSLSFNSKNSLSEKVSTYVIENIYFFLPNAKSRYSHSVLRVFKWSKRDKKIVFKVFSRIVVIGKNSV